LLIAPGRMLAPRSRRDRGYADLPFHFDGRVEVDLQIFLSQLQNPPLGLSEVPDQTNVDVWSLSLLLTGRESRYSANV
jgi:hypothetical protein